MPEFIPREWPAEAPPPKLGQPKDMVNHPPHYKTGGIETIDFIEAKALPYHLGNVVKYVSRASYKGSMLEDLKKAQWYLNRYVELLKGTHKAACSPHLYEARFDDPLASYCIQCGTSRDEAAGGAR